MRTVSPGGCDLGEQSYHKGFECKALWEGGFGVRHAYQVIIKEPKCRPVWETNKLYSLFCAIPWNIYNPISLALPEKNKLKFLLSSQEH